MSQALSSFECISAVDRTHQNCICYREAFMKVFLLKIVFLFHEKLNSGNCKTMEYLLVFSINSDTYVHKFPLIFFQKGHNKIMFDIYCEPAKLDIPNSLLNDSI